tara:strand:+ start:609 stop:1346 length:738 start_codon:yes stop_codon:yes gene_type:complete
MRIIARLDIKNNILIKSIMYDGVKQLGDPGIYADQYFIDGIDELMIINNTGSLYNTKLDGTLLSKIRKGKAIPISAGGGISSYDDAMRLIESGSDKIVINSIIHKNIKDVKKIVNTLGASSVVGAVQYEKRDQSFVTLYEMARETTGLNLYNTLSLYCDLGVGEVLVTDVKRDGCYAGLSDEINDEISIFYKKMPILLSGGFFDIGEIKKKNQYLSGIVVSSSFHYNKLDISTVISERNKICFNN